MIPIPRAAMAVVRRLRIDVPRPSTEPITSEFSHGWRRTHSHTSPTEPVLTCPMGLHPKSLDSMPGSVSEEDYVDFPAKYKAITAFAKWWDSYPATRIQEAIDQIWPPDRKRRSRKPKETACPVEPVQVNLT